MTAAIGSYAPDFEIPGGDGKVHHLARYLERCRAECTPQAFLIDQAGVLGYGGAIDHNPQEAGAVKYSYLRNAIAHLLSGNEIVTTLTRPVGCSVKWRPA